MANDSKKRSDFFTSDQCQKLLIPEPFQGQKKCDQTANRLFPVFATYFHTYHMNFYMNDWCSRNSKNLSQKIKDLGLLSDREYSIVYTYNSSGLKHLNPLASRSHTQGWKFHVFLVTQDGIVMDLDFKKQPQMLTLDHYLNQMWGSEQINEMSFQIRKPTDSADITFLEFKNSLDQAQYPVLSPQELLKKYNSPCELNLGQLNY